MKSSQTSHLIIIRNKTRLEKIEMKFNTVSQAKFYIQQSQTNFYEGKKGSKKKVKKAANTVGSGDFDEFEREHANFYTSLENIQKGLQGTIKTKVIDREFLPNYLFSENDIVVVIGQDGLVANTAKYIDDIPIIAVNPDPERYDGILLPFNVRNFQAAVEKVLRGDYKYKSVTMAEARLNDGQRLLAFNDLFIGPRSHSSARYQISYHGQTENHSSSGIIVSTGAGSTGWLSSLYNMARGVNQHLKRSMGISRQGAPEAFGEELKIAAEAEVESAIEEAAQQSFGETVPHGMPWDTDRLVFVVREPFRSKTSQIDLTAGTIQREENLIVESFMSNKGVIFSDGIESDFLQFNSGTIAEIGIAREKARLVMPD